MSSAKFDLSLALGEQRASDGSPAGLNGVIEYATDLFDRASMEAMAARLVRLLEAAVAEPERAIGSLDLLAPDERHTILHGWNDTARAVAVRHLAGAVRRAGRAHARCGRGGVRGAEPQLRASSMRAPTSWRIICAGSASAPRPWSGSASSARPRCWSGCSASSRPAAPICRSIPTIRPSAWPSCSRMPARRCWSRTSALLDRLPAHGARVVRLDADWPTIAQQPIDGARHRPRSAPPRLRHLHLGLHRHARRAWWSTMPALPTSSWPCDRTSPSGATSARRCSSPAPSTLRSSRRCCR